jgi:hypothetical protein
MLSPCRVPPLRAEASRRRLLGVGFGGSFVPIPQQILFCLQDLSSEPVRPTRLAAVRTLPDGVLTLHSGADRVGLVAVRRPHGLHERLGALGLAIPAVDVVEESRVVPIQRSLSDCTTP